MIARRLLEPSRISRPLRFVLVGGVNTAFGYIAFATCLAIGLEPAWTLTVSTLLGVAFNFLTTGSFAFGSRDPRRLPAFCLAYAALYAVNLSLLRMLAAIGIAPAAAQALLVVPLAAMSYVIQHDLVFRPPRRNVDVS